jgi:hypothetical protein
VVHFSIFSATVHNNSVLSTRRNSQPSGLQFVPESWTWGLGSRAEEPVICSEVFREFIQIIQTKAGLHLHTDYEKFLPDPLPHY